MIKEFKEFIMRGNVLDLAVAVIIGGAFGSIITSLVNDVIMPPIGLLLGKVDFSNMFFDLSGDTPYALKGDGFLEHARRNRPRWLPTGLPIPVYCFI